jgi:predicted adenine nucleotide alpha hydrolase (AANH) superfamily ATPase
MGEGYETVGFFYGSNIHPAGEWRLRMDAVKKLSSIMGAESEIAPYDPEIWLRATGGLSGEPEGGARCRACFGLQLSSAARFAAELGFGYLCTTLSISPHKDPALIDAVGEAHAKEAGVRWVSRVWRKNDGFRLSVGMSREMGLYRQNYCGCRYSARIAPRMDECHERAS